VLASLKASSACVTSTCNPYVVQNVELCRTHSSQHKLGDVSLSQACRRNSSSNGATLCSFKQQLLQVSWPRPWINTGLRIYLCVEPMQAISQTQTMVPVLQCRKANFADADVSPLLLAAPPSRIHR
jgi:hypothetical protein